MTREVIMIGKLSIYGRPSLEDVRPRGLFLRPDGLTGLDGGATVRAETVPVPGEHGEFDLPVYRGARAITIAAMGLTENTIDQGKLRADVLGVGGDGRLVTIRAEHQGQLLSCRGRIAAPPAVRDHGQSKYPFRVDYDLQFVCRDPRLYGDVHPSAAGEPALNRGNFPAIPTIYARRVSGSGGYTITAGSGVIEVTAPLAVGATHRIDLRTGGVYAGSTRLTRAIGAFRPWTVLPGTPLVHNASAGIDLTVETPRTYI
ncbi:hypothetical protein [Leucobacter tenebrionis]|uniref:hypothetical protein n=1 Tax=Leucobacter tenebrionis TaxID=2873270 RepID=UPI001CA74847|nr:hypothetical protein [Leucobacter tenebrionis]QZY52926.1 hypothetical protein KVY00_05690 [Leucobacter tenebrionis]